MPSEETGVAAEPRRGRPRIEKRGPIHAEGLDRLVGLNATIRAGREANTMQLDLELSCGFAPVQISGLHFDMALRTCFVSLVCTNCDIVAHSRYEYWLNSGSLKAVRVERDTTGRRRNSDIGFEAALGSTKMMARLFTKLGWGRSSSQSTATGSITQRNTRIDLIATSGQGRWRVGDASKGDARRDDGLLSGSYFGETKGGARKKPICNLEHFDRNSPAGITIRVTAPIESLVYLPSDSATISNSSWESWTPLRRHQQRRQVVIAGLVTARAIREAQRSAGLVSGGELLIVQHTLFATRHSLPTNPGQDVQIPGLASRALSRIVGAIDDPEAKLSALVKAAGLDPKTDFRGGDFRGWPLAGQDIRGIDFTGADLRGTQIGQAIFDDTTILTDARLDLEDSGI
jgi:hypothetical protein